MLKQLVIFKQQTGRSLQKYKVSYSIDLFCR